SFIPFDELPHIKPKNPRMNYTCPVCAKEIFNKADFRRHYMVHTGERPYPCSHCPYRARQLYNLRSHVSNKHP
ncbi:Zinc finger C2H2-type, partial [Trinorchestia longiramus]